MAKKQLDLRSIFLIVFLTGIVCAWKADHREQRAVIRALEARNAELQSEAARHLMQKYSQPLQPKDL